MKFGMARTPERYPPSMPKISAPRETKTHKAMTIILAILGLV